MLHSVPSAAQAREGIERFRVVIYLAKSTAAFPELEMRSCEDHALAFGWEVSLTFVDDETDRCPEQRPLLLAALQTVRDDSAGAILVPSRAAVSPIDGEYDDFSALVEKAGGFVQVARR
ncbi:hypothetical protein ACIRS1_22005 [Kitasatospora sp. NPDC101176]|uniref:hypothetical protein n=1 Tax=Kitasatospora sp. NPDC101176 TaxID=3364099 RepID=UPI0037F2E54C